MEPHRAERISEALREELSEIIEYELGDPRVHGVAVTAVHVTPDLRHAHVMVVSGGTPEEEREALEGLAHASHYMRRELASRIRVWRIPELHFEAESSGAAGRVEQLLERVRKSRKNTSEK
ncbi:MAG: 30S ribosome-binding factor RbfA [Rhodospirillales bacterium]